MCLLGNVEDQRVIFQANALIYDSLQFKEPIIFSFVNRGSLSAQTLIAAQRVMVCTKNVKQHVKAYVKRPYTTCILRVCPNNGRG